MGGLGHGGGDDFKSRGGKRQLGRNGRWLGRAELEGRGVAGQGFRGCGDGLSGERRDIRQKRGGDGRGGVGAGGKGLQKSCGGAGLDERIAQTVAHEIVDKAGLAETDFRLRGVNVDIHFFRRHLEEHEDDGEGGGRHDVAIGLADCVQDEAVAHEALIDEDINGIAVELLQFGLGEKSA